MGSPASTHGKLIQQTEIIFRVSVAGGTVHLDGIVTDDTRIMQTRVGVTCDRNMPYDDLIGDAMTNIVGPLLERCLELSRHRDDSHCALMILERLLLDPNRAEKVHAPSRD